MHCAGHESNVIVTTQIREILAREPKPGTQCLSHQSVPVTRSCGLLLALFSSLTMMYGPEHPETGGSFIH